MNSRSAGMFLSLILVIVAVGKVSATPMTGCSYQLTASFFPYIPFINEFQTFADIEDKLQPGDILCFEEGQYSGISIENVHATQSSPIVLKSIVDKGAHISLSDYKGTGISLRDSSYIRIEGFKVSGGLYGIRALDSHDVVIQRNWIENVGQEAILATVDKCSTDSGNFNISENRILTTGRKNPQYGEGIYIGSGKASLCGIETVLINGNAISETTNEAIDIKYNVSDVLIQNNRIDNIDLAFNGVITLSTSEFPKVDGKYRVLNNRISNFVNRNGYTANAIAIGNGSALIKGNDVKNEGGLFIRFYDSLKATAFDYIEVESNTLSGGLSYSNE